MLLTVSDDAAERSRAISLTWIMQAGLISLEDRGFDLPEVVGNNDQENRAPVSFLPIDVLQGSLFKI